MRPRVFVDTNVLKFSATELQRLRPRRQTIRWGHIQQEVTVYDQIVVNPNDKIKNSDLKREAEQLPALAELGKSLRVEYVMQVEAEFESWGLRNMDSATGRFYGAPITNVEAPVWYGRTMIGAGIDAKKEQLRFLLSLKNRRFLELQKITGAYQGRRKTNRNQLLDAFHIWCAEHNKCDYFLTLDFKLIRLVNRVSRKALGVLAVKPSELMAKLSV